MEDDGEFNEVNEKEPSDLFFEYFNLEFWEELSIQTNLYSVQQRAHKSVKTTAHELMKLAGLFIAMGTLKYPQVRMYWSRELGLPYFFNTMTRDRFSELRNYLQFADNSTPREDSDKLWKIRLFIDCVRNKYITLPRPEHISIDEQMIPFSGRCQFRQYVPSKPNSLELKNFILTSTEGLVLYFKLY
ncbi:hypothetical protein AVEN_193968-1 [Araneus ventricosus]|uniref:PiggyBac transposable element-derived protein domain-containing protein n=1 Tax=Araneus ventricosus TaxID=182803 RepID=A0A4Y2SL79_ARAVE|nr:hypothetical protein AVEN_193968-1 [Araneus ventricosus]